MDLLRLSLVVLILYSLGCSQLSYYWNSAKGQIEILNHRIPIETALKDPNLTEDQKRKLALVQKVKRFSEENLHLKPNKNYSSFSDLHRPYVSWVVQAAPKWELKHHLWDFPFVGKVPYKGFFSADQANAEAAELATQDLDTYVRGVTAYSSLGYFDDPVLNTMLTYSDHHLVDLIIHESTHATLYMKNSSNFNERLATFVAQIGTELFYQELEGPKSTTLKKIRVENEDQNTFSKFIGAELEALKKWYESNPERSETQRQNRLNQIYENFKKNLRPKLKFPSDHGLQNNLNNASLLVYKTYVEDLSDFSDLYNLLGQNLEKFLNACKGLENETQPEISLKVLVEKCKQSPTKRC